MLVESHRGHLRFWGVVVVVSELLLAPFEEFTAFVVDGALEPAVKIGAVGGQGNGMDLFLSPPITPVGALLPPDPSSSWIISIPFSADLFPFFSFFFLKKK